MSNHLSRTRCAVAALAGLAGGLVALAGPPAVAPAVLAADEPLPVLTVADIALNENDAGIVNAVFTAELSTSSTRAVVADYYSSDGSAVAPFDYLPCVGSLVFPPGSLSQSISCQVKGDPFDEPAENFFLNLTAPGFATLGTIRASATIEDSDPQAAIYVADAQVREGTSGTATAVFALTLSVPSGQPVSVQFTTSNGTATAPADYQTTSGSVSFAPGQTAASILVPVVGDQVEELVETFNVTLSNPSNAAIADGQAQGFISNGGTRSATLTISSASVDETGSDASIGFTVRLSPSQPEQVTVQYATSNGTASEGADYQAMSDTLVFPPGETTSTITVPILPDTIDEPNEVFYITLRNPSGAAIASGRSVGTIRDDDEPPTLSIEGCTVAENAGVPCNLTLKLSGPSANQVTVEFTTTNGLAIAPNDFAARSGRLAFAPGTTQRTLGIPVEVDDVKEANENFFVLLSDAVNATILDNSAAGTITDDDTLPGLSVGDCKVGELPTRPVSCPIPVTLSAASGQPITVQYATSDGTATAPADYVSAAGTLTFLAGTTVQTVTLTVKNDTVGEPTEEFSLVLNNPVNAGIDDAISTVTIFDAGDDPDSTIIFLPFVPR